MTNRRRLAILGSTGSIGRQTLDIVRAMPDTFEVAGLAAGGFSDALRAQIAEFLPTKVAVGRGGDVPAGVLTGPEGLCDLASSDDVDLVVMATVGTAGLAPTLAALEAGKNVALANKEALVMAGSLVTRTASDHGAQLLPVDSEHSAIWQCLRGEGERSEWSSVVRTLILTASGGALRDLPSDGLGSVTPREVLAHPTWKMGPKVTVDSATLMNKGLEVIEAHWLFGMPLEKIEVVLHRESVVHSLVEFLDGSLKAQLGPADMRIPIQYALCYPERRKGLSERLDMARLGTLSFGRVDLSRYPCLGLALESARRGLSYPAAMSAANEVAVDLFMQGQISFAAIPSLVKAVLERHDAVDPASLDVILHVDEWARRECVAASGKSVEGF